MANALRGEAPLGDYTLAYDFGVFIELESKTGVKTPRLLATVKEEGFGFGRQRLCLGRASQAPSDDRRRSHRSAQ
jgi:hypothetical protein